MKTIYLSFLLKKEKYKSNYSNERFLATMGLIVSDAFRMLLTRIAREKALSFESLAPNDETIVAMKAARKGKLVKVGRIDNLLDDLNNEDDYTYYAIQERI